jgi:hypothetical protein
MLTNKFYEASFTLLLKPDEEKKGNYTPISAMIVVVSIPYLLPNDLR